MTAWENLVKYASEKRSFSLPQLRVDLKMSYTQACSAVDKLVAEGVVTFNSGVYRLVENAEERTQKNGLESLSESIEYFKNRQAANDESKMSKEEFILRVRVLWQAIEYGTASASLIQRWFDVGFLKACTLLEWMQQKGYISEYRGASKREMLITAEQFDLLYGDVELDLDEDAAVADDSDEDAAVVDDGDDEDLWAEIDDIFKEEDEDDETDDKDRQTSDLTDGELDGELTDDELTGDGELTEGEKCRKRLIEQFEKTVERTLSQKDLCKVGQVGFDEYGWTIAAPDEAGRLIAAIKLVRHAKSQPVSTDAQPDHSLWTDEGEFESAVFEVMCNIVKSGKRIGRSRAIRIAEIRLDGVRDTHDRARVQLYERVVYELKKLSVREYGYLRVAISAI